MPGPEAKDIMTEGVIAIEGDRSVEEAAELLRDENIGSLIVNDGEEAIGIVVGSDIVHKVVAGGRDPSQVSVSRIMTEDLVTADVNDDVADIARAMIENDISRVPVLRGDDMVVGIITENDIMRTWPGYLDILDEKDRLEGTV
jgi:CBS domain-containing protein